MPVVAYKDTSIAYLLWALCFVGVAGLNRIYLGKYFSGIIWFLTLGLLGLGVLYDLFTIPAQTRAVNRENGHYFSGR